MHHALRVQIRHADRNGKREAQDVIVVNFDAFAARGTQYFPQIRRAKLGHDIESRRFVAHAKEPHDIRVV